MAISILPTIFVLNREKLHFALPVNVIYDLIHLPPYQGTEYFGNQFLLITLTLFFFSNSRSKSSLIQYFLCLFIASLYTPLIIPAALVFILSLFQVPQLKKIDRFLIQNHISILVSTILLISIVSTLYFFKDQFFFGDFYALRMFGRSVYNLNSHLGINLLLLAVCWHLNPNKDDHLSQRALISVCMMLIGGVMFTLLIPFIPWDVSTNGDRFEIYVTIFSLITIFKCIEQFPTMWQKLSKKIALLSLILLGHNLIFHERFFQTKIYSPMDKVFLPIKKVGPKGKPYYFAAHPQQVYNYFIDRLYKKAPLVLNINNFKNHSEKKAVEHIGL
jgi:hypothetical protein